MGLLGKVFKKDSSTDSEKKKEKKVTAKPAAKVEVDNKENKQSNNQAIKQLKQELDSPATKKVTKKAEKVSKKIMKKDDERAYKVVAYPMITEKATDLAIENKYVFAVPVNATKPEVLKTVANIYGVKPVSVNMIRRRGKKVRYGRKFGKTKDFKKAIVTLSPEDKIEVYEGV